MIQSPYGFCKKCGGQRLRKRTFRHRKTTVNGGRDVILKEQKLSCKHWVAISQEDIE